MTMPVIYQGGLTGRWWCATKWKRRPGGEIEALEKHDVTGQIQAIIDEATRQARQV